LLADSYYVISDWDEGSFLAEEGARPILHDIVDQARAHDISAPAEPSNEGWIGTGSSQVALSVAIGAFTGVEVSTTDDIVVDGVRGQDEVVAAVG
jgi:hypothetical protein